MLFSAIGNSIMMLTLLEANPQNIISQIISFSVGNMSILFFIYIGSILICFHNGGSVRIILCILCQLLHCVVTACENLSVFIHVVIAKHKCSINDSIKSEHLFIKGVIENAECKFCNAEFCIAHGCRSDVVNQVKTKQNKNINWLFKTKLPITA
jgi:hypothetical protein